VSFFHADRVELQASRNDIADFLGLTIETVSRTFTRLRDQHVIDICHPQSIVIMDFDRLEGLAKGDCERSKPVVKLSRAGR
jgi:CRP/FNR family transcriptional regulator, anaerobic regulatory protein